MNNTIYWHQFDVPQKYKYKIGDKEVEGVKTQELRCSDERVERVWYTGSMSAGENDYKMHSHVHFIFKDGSRHDFDLKTADWESEASKYLSEIK